MTSVPKHLIALLAVYSMLLGMIWGLGVGTSAIYESLDVALDPESRADDVLSRYVASANPEHFRRYVEVLGSRSGPSGHQQLEGREPNFAAVYAILREDRLPFWLDGMRVGLSVVVPSGVLDPVPRLDAEGSRLLAALAPAITAFRQQGPQGGRAAEIQRHLT